MNSLYSAQLTTVCVCILSLGANLTYNCIERRYADYLIVLNSDVSIDELDAHSPVSADGSVRIKYGAVDNRGHEPSDEVMATARASEILCEFSILFWLLLLHVGLTSPILYTFTAFGPLYLQENFESTRTAEAAGDAISLLYMAIVAAPFVGMVIDRVGHRSLFQLAAAANIPVIFLLLTYKVIEPTWCLFWMGLCYSVTEANSLALISLIVPPAKQGAAFGLLGCSISLALLVEPWAVGYLRQTTGTFTVSIWIFTAITGLGAVLALVVFLYDRAHGSVVSGSPKSASAVSHKPSSRKDTDF
jgi:hypothetical protein